MPDTSRPAVPVPPSDLRVVGSGLRFCEGPVWLDDDTVLVTEIAAGTLTTVSLATGDATRVVDGLAGPNGAALAPGDPGSVWVADNGGFFGWVEAEDRLFPAPGNPAHLGGSLMRADLDGGGVEVVCAEVAGAPLVAPNDLVVDAGGGVWFTDFGVQDATVSAGRPGVVFVPAGAVPQRSVPVVWGTHQANGIGLSADGGELYVAETHGAAVWAFAVRHDGEVAGGGGPGERHAGRLVHRSEGVMFDSLAVDPDGWVCVATIGAGGGVTCVDPRTGEVARVGAPDELTTNVAFRPVANGTVRAVFTLSSVGALAIVDDWVAARDAARVGAGGR